MKMFIFSSLFVSFFFLFSAFGQVDDPRSKKIIDDMVVKFNTYPSMSVDFSMLIENKQDGSETEQEVKFSVKKDKYKLEVPDFVLYFDGTKNYQYFPPPINEVMITIPYPDDDVEDFQLLNPQTYFNLSSKSFRSNLVRETTQDKRSVYEIDLYPVHIKDARYSRIRIMVEKSTLQFVYIKVFMNNGIHCTLSFKPYNIFHTALGDSFFVFNKNEHPNVEVIDLTF